MAAHFWLATLVSAVFFVFGYGSPALLDVQVLTRNAPGASTADTHAALAQGLAAAALQKRDMNHTASVRLNKSWENAPIFKIGDDYSIDISCKTCYINGLAVAELSIQSDQNTSEIIENIISEVDSDVNTTVHQTYDAIYAYVSNTSLQRYFSTVSSNILDNGLEASDFVPPTLNVSFDTHLTSIPTTTITFRFENLDLYLELETTLNVSKEYTLPLVPPDVEPTEISLPGLLLGVSFTADLILAVDGSLDITSGLHLKVDDHVALDIQLFGNEVSGIDFTGGQFELLPVTVQSAEASFTATLRLGAKAELSVGEDLKLPDKRVFGNNISDFSLGGSIMVGVHADVAEFYTEVKADPEDAECKVKVLQEYSFVLGAAAGAQVTVGDVTYGPAVAATTPVFTTTMESLCVLEPAATASSAITTAAAQRRQESNDAALATTIVATYSAVQCPSTITGQCPVSLQTTVKSIETLTTTVPGSTTIAPIAFGTNVKALSPISGRPTTYVAPSSTNNGGFVSQATDTVRKHKHIAIGVGIGVGVGVPVLVVVAGAIFFYLRHRKYSSVPTTESPPSLKRPAFQIFTGSNGMKRPDVRETERISS